MYVILNHLYRYFMSWSIPIKNVWRSSLALILLHSVYMQTIVNAVVHFSVQKISKILFIFCLISVDKKKIWDRNIDDWNVD